MVRGVAVAACIFVAMSALDTARAAETSSQAIYDAAQAAFDKEDWAGALHGFETLLPSNPDQALSHSQAVIAGRLAFALEHLGRYDEAQVVAKRAILALPPNDIALSDTLITAGDAARFSFDYTAAAPLYERALSVAKSAGDRRAILITRIDLAYAETTINPVAVGSELDQALSDKAELATLTKSELALIEDLRARAAANAGDAAKAEHWASRAIEDSGGLTTAKVSLSQIAIRNDAAIIAALNKNDDATHRYLAYTGAGHLKNMSWIGSFDGELPVCAEETDIRPSDSVVVQFSIADDGHVNGALPVYASRPGALGAVFAQAVNSWHWNAQSLQGVDPFWRNALVLELSCASRPSPVALDRPVRQALAAWLSSKGVTMSGHFADLVHADDPRLRAQGPEAIPALFARVQNHDAAAPFARLRTVLDANDAPPAAYALLLAAEANAHSHGSNPREHAQGRAAYLSTVAPALRDRYPDDPATAWLLLYWALAYEDAGDFRSAQPLIQAVLDMPRNTLPDDAPVRRVALLHRAMTASRTGTSAAVADLAESGLTAEQCSVFDTHPIPTSLYGSSSQFPAEAMRWGFEGYVRESFDITADGHVANPRAVVAYPPLIFGANTATVARGFRFVPPKIGNTPVGCIGQTERIQYGLSR